jgi:hypothetical protein
MSSNRFVSQVNHIYVEAPPNLQYTLNFPQSNGSEPTTNKSTQYQPNLQNLPAPFTNAHPNLFCQIL